MCGVRAKISVILPASLRAGIITETEGGSADGLERGLGRATMKLVKARCLSGQSLTRQRLAKPATSGVGMGQRISCHFLIISQSVRLSRPAMSSIVSQF